MRRSAALTLAGLLAVLPTALAGCTRAAGSAAEVRLAWRELRLPPVPSGRLSIRALASCPGHLYAVGTVTTAGPPTFRPAAFASTDTGSSWTPVPTAPVSVYGPQQILTSAACTGDRLVAVGGMAGGAHGNLRISTWLSVAGGPLTEIRAPFEQYGGPDQLDTGRIAAGPRGFVIEGDRAHDSPGAAAWSSGDGSAFTLVDRDPALLSTPALSTAAADVTALPDGSWLLVGSGMRPGQVGRRDPLAWHSPDGLHWRSVSPPPAPPDESFDRVVVSGDTVIAAGPRDTRFGAWTMPSPPTAPAPTAPTTTVPGTATPAPTITVPGTATPAPTTWLSAGTFDRLGTDEPPSVTGLVALDHSPNAAHLVATVDNGTAAHLWVGGIPADPAHPTWRQLSPPSRLPTGTAAHLSTAATGTTLILAIDDGMTTHLWQAEVGRQR